LSRLSSLRRCFTIVQPFRKYIDRFVQMMNRHLITGGTQSTSQTTNSGSEIHLALDDFIVGAKGTFESFGERGAFFSLHLKKEEEDS
jgi:hypothetical protein